MLLTKENIAIIEGDTTICKWVKEQGTLEYDYGSRQLLRKRLGHIPPNKTAIDIGAFIGDTTHSLSQWYDVVFAFEPNPLAYECLLHNSADNVHCFNTAIGKHGHCFEISECGANQGATQVSEGSRNPSGAFLGLDGIKNVDFIKIDVEGMEYEVLTSCRRIIERDHPRLLIEQRPKDGNEEKVFGFLEEYNYKWEALIGDPSIQCDYFCE